MRTLLLISALTLLGCQTPASVRPPLFRPEEMIERQPLPPHPDTTKLDQYTGGEKDVEPISKDDPSPMDGIVVSEKRAARDSEYRSRYHELRLRLEMDSKVFDKHRMLYEYQLDAAHNKIHDLQPTFWERYALEIGLISGIVIGTGMTIGVAYAIQGATK